MLSQVFPAAGAFQHRLQRRPIRHIEGGKLLAQLPEAFDL